MTEAERLIIKSFNDSFNAEEKARQANIQKLINYYNGDQIQYLKQYLKLKNLDDFPYYASNITKRIIRKLAEVYKEAPKRLINGKQNDKYNELIENKNRKLKTIERQARLLGLLGVRPVVINNKFDYVLLRQFQAYFKDEEKPYAIKYLIQKTDDEQYYEYWDTENHFVLNSNNVKVNIKKFGFKDEKNEYGIIPFVWCHSEEIIDDWYNTGGSADDLINANEQINLTLSELAHKYRYTAFNPPYFIGTTNVDDFKWGYNQIMHITDTEGQIGVLNLNYDFRKDIEWIKFQIQSIERNNGLNINWGISGNTSGFSLVIQNIDHKDDLVNMIDICRGWENDLFEMEQIIGKVHGVKVPAGQLSIDYAEVKAPLSIQEQNAKWTFEFQNQLSSREDYWREQNPDISDEEIQERLAKITTEAKTVKELTRTEPTIGELFNAE